MSITIQLKIIFKNLSNFEYSMKLYKTSVKTHRSKLGRSGKAEHTRPGKSKPETPMQGSNPGLSPKAHTTLLDKNLLKI